MGGSIAAFVLVGGVSWNIACAGAAADTLAAAYGVPLATIGLLTTALFAVQMVTAIPAGRTIDRVGARPVAASALAVTAAGNGLLVTSPAIGVALAGRAVVGLGVGLAFLAGARIVQLAGGGVLAQGVYGGFGLAGGGLALAIVPALEGALDWRAPWIGALVACIPGAIALAAPSSRAGASAGSGAGHGVALGAVARDPGLRPFMLAHAASFGFSVVLANWTVPLLDRAGHPRATAGAVGAAVLLLGIVSRPLGGALARRDPARTAALLRASLVAGAAGATLLAALPGTLPVAAAGAVLAGIAGGIPFGPVFAGAAHARPDAPGTAVAIVNTVAVAGIVAATPLLGLTFDLPGEGRIGMAALGALLVVAAASPWLRPAWAAPRDADVV